MARPQKRGLDYFSLDVDFYSDRKIRKILKDCGPSGITILLCMLCNIYKEGYYIGWSEDMCFDIAELSGVSLGSVKEVCKKAIQVGIFDSNKFNAYKILTSQSIQLRYKAGVTKRKDVSINPEFWIISDEKRVSDVNNSVSSDRNTQSKVKNNLSLTRVERFHQDIASIESQYPDDAAKFKKYWCEMNDIGVMRFEMQDTWDTYTRFEMWQSNGFDKKSTSKQQKESSVKLNTYEKFDESKLC